MEQAIEIRDLKFISNDFIIFKNGIDISGHCYGYWRGVRIKKNKEGAEAYNVSLYKLDANRLTWGNSKLISSRQMKLVEQNNLQIQFSNFGTDKQGNSIPNYRLLLRLNNNLIEEIAWKGYNINTDILFLKAPSKEVENAINIPLNIHLTTLNDTDRKADRSGLIERYQMIVKEIETKGKGTEAMADYYFFLGKVKFSQGEYREAKEAFSQSNMVLQFNGLPSNHEVVYWFGKVNEAEGKVTEAKMFYRLALERYKDNSGLISKEEIIKALKA